MVAFIAAGFWKAFLFIIILGSIGAVLSLLFKKIPILKTLLQYGSHTAGWYIVWCIRGGFWWLFFAIMATITLIIVLLIAIFAQKALKALSGSKNSFVVNDAYITSFLSSYTQSANKNLPQMIDEETRLDKTVALPNKTIQLHHTLVNLAKDEIDLETGRNSMYPRILNNIKTNPNFQDFRNNQVTFEYVYHDKNGIEVLTMVFEYKDYV